MSVRSFIISALISAGVTPGLALGAPPSPPAQQEGVQPSQGGMASSGPQKAQFDSRHRPITAGGFVKTGPIIFQNVAEAAGLTRWHHTAGTPEKRLILEAKGPGVCLLDYDNDGWMDIYLVNGSTYDALAGKVTPPHAALFHNNHDGTFTDVTEKAGVANDRWGYGCAVGDYDNDGWPDIYVSNYGKNRLYHNNHDGTFTDVGEKAGVTVGTWSAGRHLWRLRWGWSVGPVCRRLRPNGLVDPSLSRIESGQLLILCLSRDTSDVRSARPERRARSSFP